jgi:hypothetical protein
MYATWQDMKSWVDQKSALSPGETMTDGPAPDAPKYLQTFVGLAEREFTNEVRGFVLVPIDATASPELFAQAKDVCAMRAASMMMKARRQAAGTERQDWYDGWLLSQAQKIVEQIKASAMKAPDAQTATNPVVLIPTFGGLTRRCRPHRREVW